MDIRIQLDQEIATYRALLQEEENRLNLTPTPREKRTRSRTQQATERDSASKRQRLEESSVSSHAAGFIQISEVDPDGKFVQIRTCPNRSSPWVALRSIMRWRREKRWSSASTTSPSCRAERQSLEIPPQGEPTSAGSPSHKVWPSFSQLLDPILVAIV